MMNLSNINWTAPCKQAMNKPQEKFRRGVSELTPLFYATMKLTVAPPGCHARLEAVSQGADKAAALFVPAYS